MTKGGWCMGHGKLPHEHCRWALCSCHCHQTPVTQGKTGMIEAQQSGPDAVLETPAGPTDQTDKE